MRLMKPMWQSTQPDRPRQHRLSRSSEDHLTATALTSINDDLQRAKTKVEALSRDALKLMAPLLRQRQNLVAIEQSGDTEVTSLGHFDFHNFLLLIGISFALLWFLFAQVNFFLVFLHHVFGAKHVIPQCSHKPSSNVIPTEFLIMHFAEYLERSKNLGAWPACHTSMCITSRIVSSTDSVQVDRLYWRVSNISRYEARDVGRRPRAMARTRCSPRSESLSIPAARSARIGRRRNSRQSSRCCARSRR